ncbi:KsdD-like steroid dehydrogenase [Kordiimonas sediminis]|uniref:KsdD-like steroid dehydrogenase n=1 Tax=Kordiimonas sediminis TaxID=1735581 RepID=A0A919APX1_9PROT|nr:FAD-binding dehydrogenase [Kordiimonas sediminis]GHF20752.1 KsdD-like steroid dehydrogenase [Kordiimonas sediminis]
MTETSDIIIVGGGIAGITVALELLEAGDKRHITLLDRCRADEFGGLARWAFGGMSLCATPQQKRLGIKDSPDLMLKDWRSFAEFEPEDYWPERWAQDYAENNRSLVYDWIIRRGLRFIPAVQWVERGLYAPGNSVPRYHVLWGTAKRLTDTLISHLEQAAARSSSKLTIQFETTVKALETTGGSVTGVQATNSAGDTKSYCAETVIVTTGGIGGNIPLVKKHWPKNWGAAPGNILNGNHPYNDGALHEATSQIGGAVTHLDKMWNYAAGVPHPQPSFDGHGLSLIPTRSSLWCDHLGKRIGPMPLVTGFDTNFLCQQVAQQEKPWSWHILNYRIARRELAISGADHNPYIRDRQAIRFIIGMLRGDPWLIDTMLSESDDFIAAGSLDELVQKMNGRTDSPYIKAHTLRDTVETYDSQVKRAPKQWNDDQVRRLQHLRQWTGDKIRTCKYQPILDNKALPLIAIKTHLISRKSLGGIQTNLHGQVLNTEGTVIPGLFAAGEATGFGGGGASGKRSLEGTFLSGCIHTARRLAETLLEQRTDT